MKIRRTSAALAVTVTGALLFSACSGTSGDGTTETDDSGINTESAVTVAWEAPLNELNLSSANGNATQNAVINYMLNSGFNYYDADLNLVQDESFGTYKKVSDDPLTIEYTVGDDTKWSDGTPFDATDILLEWAGSGTNLNTVQAETDEEGNVTNQDAVDAGVYFDGSSPGVALIQDTPTISDDGKTITTVYSKPFGDWELNFTNQFVPAHVVGQKALGIEDAQEAKDAVRDAILNNDTAALSKISAFWNSGFEFVKMPDDPALTVSTGAYTL
ncbi:MAG: ABC transporter family substrate-binding protein, partial [Cellulosimicrobium cellulans]